MAWKTSCHILLILIMKKFLILILSLILIIYPLYAIYRCIAVLGSLTNYGKGVLTGGIFIFATGIALLIYAIKLFKTNS